MGFNSGLKGLTFILGSGLLRIAYKITLCVIKLPIDTVDGKLCMIYLIGKTFPLCDRYTYVKQKQQSLISLRFTVSDIL